MLMKKISLSKWGNSQGIRISNDVLEELNIEENDIEFLLEVKGNKIILTPKKKYPQTLNELFADYEGEPLENDDKYDWGESVGREFI